MTHDPREKLREVAHVHHPLLLEVREQALERHAPVGKPGPRPVVLAFEDAEQAFLQHASTLPRVARLGEEVAEELLGFRRWSWWRRVDSNHVSADPAEVSNYRELR